VTFFTSDTGRAIEEGPADAPLYLDLMNGNGPLRVQAYCGDGSFQIHLGVHVYYYEHLGLLNLGALGLGDGLGKILEQSVDVNLVAEVVGRALVRGTMIVGNGPMRFPRLVEDPESNEVSSILPFVVRRDGMGAKKRARVEDTVVDEDEEKEEGREEQAAKRKKE